MDTGFNRGGLKCVVFWNGMLRIDQWFLSWLLEGCEFGLGCCEHG
jgi:hypothetical protein